MSLHLSRHPRTAAAVAAVTLVVVGAGCSSAGGGSGDRADSSSVTSSTSSMPSASSTPSTPATAVIDPGDGGDYSPAIDPADFVDVVDNPYLPLPAGARWVYEGEGERAEIVVTDQRKEILGIDATVVRDTVTDESGALVEDTFDWFAQDVDGNVWYLGEDSTSYENGEPVNTEGSWEAGVDGAQPGIVMPAEPVVGDAYRQEFLVGEAEDLAEVRRFEPSLDTPSDTYADVLVAGEWTPLEPDVVEEKYYAPGVGLVLEVTVDGGTGRLDLVSFDPGR